MTRDYEDVGRKRGARDVKMRLTSVEPSRHLRVMTMQARSRAVDMRRDFDKSSSRRRVMAGWRRGRGARERRDGDGSHRSPRRRRVEQRGVPRTARPSGPALEWSAERGSDASAGGPAACCRL